MNPTLFGIALTMIAAPALAQDAVNFEILNGIYPLDMSTDGSVIVGNDFNFETVRWTEDTGVVNLGRGTFPLGVGAGTPDCSDDGTRVSATILTKDGTLATQGVWTEGVGWVDLMPPPPADGGIIDLAYGSAWGISGNGDHVVGLYWRPGNFDTGGAHASIASAPGAVMDLGSGGGNSRANHVNFDGTVVVGWDERVDGVWQPAVWDNGVKQILSPENGFTAADCVNAAGTIIGGHSYVDQFNYQTAAIWTRDGVGGWDKQIIGSLPGTTGPFGFTTVNSMTPDGSTLVGFNRIGSTSATGWIWNETDGMQNIVDWLTDRGVTIPSNMLIADLTCISDDGRILAGIGVNLDTGEPLGFRVSPACIADLDGNGELDFFDVSAFLGAFVAMDPVADLNGDGMYNFFDVSAFLSAFNAGCP